MKQYESNDAKFINIHSWDDFSHYCSIYVINGYFTISLKHKESNKVTKANVPKQLLSHMHVIGMDLLKDSIGDPNNTKSFIGYRYEKDSSGKSKRIPVIQIDMAKIIKEKSAYSITFLFIEENKLVTFDFKLDETFTVIDPSSDDRSSSRKVFQIFIDLISPSSLNILSNMSRASQPIQKQDTKENKPRESRSNEDIYI